MISPSSGAPTLPAGKMTILATFSLAPGDNLVTAVVDLGPTLPVAQQYTCELKSYGEVLDVTPAVYGAQIRLHLQGMLHSYSSAPVMLSCGSDAPAHFLKGRVSVVRVDTLSSDTGVAYPGF